MTRLSPSCSSFLFSPTCVCFSGGPRPALPPSPSIRPHSSALRPVKHRWDISPFPPSLLPPSCSSFLPLRPPSPCSPDSSKLWYRGVEQRGKQFHFYLLRRLRGATHCSSHPEILLISIKQAAMSRLCVSKSSATDTGMITKGKEQPSLWPIHNDCFSFFVFFSSGAS